MKGFLSFLLSWTIVAFGQPAWVPILAPFAACIGYALFWRNLSQFSSNQTKFIYSSFWFLCVQLIQLSWMTSIEFQGLYILAVYAILCVALGLQFGVISILVGRIPHVAVAALWTLLEWSRLYVDRKSVV